MTISASTVAPIAIAIPPRLMIVDGMSSSTMGMNDSATLMGNERMGSSRLRKCKQEQDDHEADGHALLDEGVLQRVDRPLDEARAIVGDRDLDARGQAGPEIGNFFFTRAMTSSAFSP